MSDIATISLRVDTTGLVAGNQALDDFRDTATGAAQKADDLNSSFKAGAASQKQSAASIREQRQELQNLLNKISPVNKALDELDAIQQNLASFRGKSLLGVEQYERYNEILETTRTRLLEAQEAETAEGRARLEQTRAAQRAAATAKNFVTALEDQVNAIGKTRTELLELKAAQLGVSQQTAPLIARLREQDEAWKRGVISAGQYQQAMRMLPMQITDVVTSLASGMPVWMVAIQQGGQIKDSFGGIAGTLRALLTFVTPLNVAIGAMAAVFGALAYSVISSNDEFVKIRESIESITGLAGDFSDKVASSVQHLADVSGQSADDIAKAYITTKDSASDAVGKLINVGLTYEQAAAKVKEYKGASNFTALNAIIADHQQKVAALGETWLDVATRKAKAMALGTFAFSSGALADIQMRQSETQGAGVRQRALQMQKDMAEVQKQSSLHVKEVTENTEKQFYTTNRIANAQRELNQLLANQKTLAGTDNVEAKKQAQYLIEQKRKEIKQLQELGNKQEKPKAVKVDAGVQESERAQRDLLTLEAQLKTLQEHRDVTSKISSQRQAYWQAESQYTILQEASQHRQLTLQEQQQLASSKQTLEYRRQAADLGDQIEKQKQRNQLEQQAARFAEQQAAKRAEIQSMADGKSSREAGRDAERDRISTTYAANPDARDKALKELEETYQKEDDLRSNWLAGAKSAWNEYYESATNVYSAIHDVAEAGFDGLSGMLDDLVTTGKASFKSFAASMLKMIAQVIDRLLVAYTIQAALGWVSGSPGGGSTPGGSYASAASNIQFDKGGYTGEGGKYDPAGIVHRGEFVFTKEATSAIGVENLYAMMKGAQGYANGGYVGKAPMAGLKGSTSAGGVAPVINTTINVDAGGGTSSKSTSDGNAMGRALAAEIESATLKVIQKQVKDGGIIYRFVKGR